MRIPHYRAHYIRVRAIRHRVTLVIRHGEDVVGVVGAVLSEDKQFFRVSIVVDEVGDF